MLSDQQTVTIVGAGLVGSLLATLLGYQGFQVDVLERRSDIRKENTSAGRSINLAVSTRALHALRHIDMEEEIIRQSVPMRGRMIHLLNGELVFQPYSENKVEYLYSISRSDLNKVLIDAAEQTGNVRIAFNHRACGMDFKAGILHLHNEKDAYNYNLQTNVVLGSDGTRSVIRQAMEDLPGHYSTEEAHSYGYKELTIPPGPNGTFLIEKNALHLWPRGTYMLLATPNREGSFTCTLFLPFEGEVSFEQLTTPDKVKEFFEQQFPDVVPLVKDLVHTFLTNPIGTMSTVRTYPWHVKDKALLIGDAAHAIVPFFGQGMNAGFEDCSVFYTCIKHHLATSGIVDWSKLFCDFTHLRKINTDAIADMAVENFVEIHNKVANKKFQMEKMVEGILERSFPGEYFSRYALVAFSCIPYKVARDVGVLNNEILRELCVDLTDVNQLDLKRAKRLIRAKLTPVLKEYAAELELKI